MQTYNIRIENKKNGRHQNKITGNALHDSHCFGLFLILCMENANETTTEDKKVVYAKKATAPPLPTKIKRGKHSK